MTQQTYEEFCTLMDFLKIPRSNIEYINATPRWYFSPYTIEFIENHGKVRISSKPYTFRVTLPIKDALEHIVNLLELQEKQ